MTNEDLVEILWVELLIGRAVLGLGLGSAQGGCWLDCESVVEMETVVFPAPCWTKALACLSVFG